MLHRLKFINFKSWSKADLEFGRITGLFGANSSGKTSLIQFLLLLKQTKDGTDRGISLDLNGPLVNLGVYKDLIYRHDVDRTLSWTLEIKTEKEISLIDPSGKRSETIAKSDILKIQNNVTSVEQGPISTRLTYSLGDAKFSLKPKRDSRSSFELNASGTDFRWDL